VFHVGARESRDRPISTLTQTLNGVQRHSDGIFSGEQQNSGAVLAAQVAFVASPAHVVQIIPTGAQRRVHVGDFALKS